MKIIFTTGLIMLIAGIVLAIAAPAMVTWESKSKILASEEVLIISAGWKSKDQVLADKVLLTASPLWKPKSDGLIDKVITVYLFETYDYCFVFTPIIFGEAKDFIISGTAAEQSSPQRLFNFYVFDSVNFDLWKAGKKYTAYYEVKGKTFFNFSFSIATKEAVPSKFYFVVEEYVAGIKPVVRVTATISWIEKNPRYEYTEYFSTGTVIFGEVKNIILNGTVTEVNNKKFNFYIMDYKNYLNWYDGKPYTAYYEKKDVSSATFFVTLTKDQATSTFYFVVENPNLNINVTVTFSAIIKWIEKTSILDSSKDYVYYGIPIVEEAKDFVLRGSVSELTGKNFNFYILDSTNSILLIMEILNWVRFIPHILRRRMHHQHLFPSP